MTRPSTAKRQISYIVFSHPDDEYASWSLIHNDAASYPVFCLLTRGEQTSYCPNPSYDPGEDTHPSLLPAPKGSGACATARVNSLRSFLARMATADEHLEDPPYIGPRTGVAGHGTVRERSYALHAGSRAALLVFDLGDGALQENEVVWAIRSAQAARTGGDLPDLPEHAVIAASYRNAVDYGETPGCRLYDHPDHRAVHRAVWNTAFGIGPQWGATALCDPDPGRTDAVEQETHEFAFSTSGSPIGAYQRSYGWLRLSHWPYHHFTDDSRRQRHWERFAA